MMTLAAGKTNPEIELAAKLVSPEYYDYLSVFSETEARALPPRRVCLITRQKGIEFSAV